MPASGTEPSSPRWHAVRRDLTTAPSTDWASVIHGATSVSGLAIATLGDLLPAETVAASDPRSRRLVEAQLDLGEGPAWDAAATGREVLVGDAPGRGATAWPAFTAAVVDEGVTGLFAFPIVFGTIGLGALDLHDRRGGLLDAASIVELAVVCRLLSRRILARAVETLSDDGTRTTALSRRVVHQATGMIAAQLRLSAGDAYLVLQGRAFAAGYTMEQAAELVMSGHIVFAVSVQGIEEHDGEHHA